VLQFNKRDLPSICTPEEINQGLNWHGWPHVEASAIHGQGVFETLKSISKLTLVALKRRLARNNEESASTEAAGRREPARAVAEKAAPASRTPAPGPATPEPTAPPVRDQPPRAPAPRAAAPTTPKPTSGKAALERTGVGRSDLDVLSELEKLRQEVQRTKPLARAQENGHSELRREIKLSVDRADFARLRRFSLNLQVEDENHRVINSIRDFTVDIKDPQGLERVLLTLSIALRSRG
jgi:hypothetical protein